VSPIISPQTFKEVDQVVLNFSKISSTIGILALLITFFIATEAAAQEQYCECYDAVRTVSVRRAPVRRIARRAKVRRSYRTTARARVRTVYRTIYVPATRVAGYSAYADDRDDLYISNNRSFYNLDAIARGWGKRDGFKDGWKAALKFRAYDPENNDDFRDANNGYRERFGSKFLYKTAYRKGYVVGYDNGFRSIAVDERYGIRY
jgi:hypothetical protein